jgi:hypothetical protein
VDGEAPVFNFLAIYYLYNNILWSKRIISGGMDAACYNKLGQKALLL